MYTKVDTYHLLQMLYLIDTLSSLSYVYHNLISHKGTGIEGWVAYRDF